MNAAADNALDDRELPRLRWRCRRGTKELDLMLMRFLDTGYSDLTELQLADFRRLLARQDPQLQGWLIEQQTPEDKGLSEIVRIIQKANHL